MARRIELLAFIKRHTDFTDEKLEYTSSELLQLVREAKDVISSEPTLIEVKLPVLIVGDIHGQYKDLRRIFAGTGTVEGITGAHSRRFLFLGDYVDRGKNSLECLSVLLAYKLAFPRMFNLLRGNHECAPINRVYGFYQELCERFKADEAENLWLAFNDLFAFLPLAAIVQKRILCMHGGISSHLNSLDDIRNIKRPLDDPNSHPLACDLLWADPMVDLAGYQPNTVRGVSVFFGEDAVLSLCEKLKLDLIVRAHQMMLNGYGFFCRRKLVTVFSAPRYYPEKNNRGAVISVNKDMRFSFTVMNPTDQNTQGPEKFREGFVRPEDDVSYVTRTNTMEISALTLAEDKQPPQATLGNNNVSKLRGSGEKKSGAANVKKSTS